MFPELARDDVFRLETRRLWLRWPRAADAVALCALAANPETAGMAGLPYPCRIEDAERFIRVSRAEAARGEALRFVLTLKSFARNVVGVIGVEAQNGAPQLYYWLGPCFRDKGYAGEAAAMLTDAFFLLSGGEQLDATVPTENVASRGVLENLGFALVERFDSAAALTAENSILRFALPRRDWRQQSRAGLRLGAGSDRALT